VACRKYHEMAEDLGTDKPETETPSPLEAPGAATDTETDERQSDEILAEARRVPPCQQAAQTAGFVIAAGANQDFLLFSYTGPCLLRYGEIELDGKLGWLRFLPDGDLRAFLVDARILKRRGEVLFESAERVKAIELMVSGEEMRLSGFGLRGPISVGAPKMRKALISGRDVPSAPSGSLARLDLGKGDGGEQPSEETFYQDTQEPVGPESGRAIADAFDGIVHEWSPASVTPRLSAGLCADSTFGQSRGALAVRMQALDDGTLEARQTFGATRRVPCRVSRNTVAEFAYCIPRSEGDCQMTLGVTDVLGQTSFHTFTPERGDWKEIRVPFQKLMSGQDAFPPTALIDSITVSLQLVVPAGQLKPRDEHRFTIDNFRLVNP
jgi:hypothetical protein